MSTNDSSVLENLEGAVRLTFGWVDYSCFAMMLAVSAAVGVYFGFFAKKQETTTDYLLGGKTMSYFPVAMSITSSHVSGITLLGIPSEVYQFGTQYAACVFTTTLIGLVTAYIYLPVFHKLQLTSTFEYLELRFARSVRQFVSVLFVVALILHTPIVVYVPALAFSQVTGFPLHYITPVICIVCIFYTTVGGLKAVVWTDTIQFTVTVITLFTVLVLGIISLGGLGEIWRISEEGGRIVFFNMDPSPFARSTFWGVTVGLTTAWTANISVNQGCMQRFLAVPTLKDAKKSILLMCIGLTIVKWLSVYYGLVIYSTYHDCDPISTGGVTRSDGMLPYYMMDIAGRIPGLPGLFLAALVSAALSTMSGGLNTAAGTIWEDFISAWFHDSETKQRTATRVMKVTVVLLGILSVGLVFVVERMGAIFEVASSMQGVTAGTVTGVFTLGVLVPWATSRGASIGGVLGFLITSWMTAGAQYHKINGNLRSETLPMNTDNCPYPLNTTDWTRPTLPPVLPEQEPMVLYTISFMYYALVGTLTVVVCGTLASFLTRSSDLSSLDRDLFSPVVHRFLPPKKYTEVPIGLVNIEEEKKASSK